MTCAMAEPEMPHNPPAALPALGTVGVIHDGPAYRVRFLRMSEAPEVVVEFAYWMPSPSLEGEFPVEGFCRNRGRNAIGVLAARNDWFQDDEILQAIAAIRAATPGWRRIGYGGSMGGYAVINFAAELELAWLFAVCPQYSIEAGRAPYEARWREEASSIAFRHDQVDRGPRIGRGWIAYDPWCVDGRHAADIGRHHDLTHLRVPLVRHQIMRALQQAGVFTPLVDAAFAGMVDAASFRWDWRAGRRRSAAFWLTLAEAMLERGARGGAARAVARARALPHPEPGEIDAMDARLAEGAADYGEDAPENRRGLLRRGLVFTGVGLVLNVAPLGLPHGLGTGFLIAGGVQLALSWWMRRSSRHGKLALRDRLLDMIAIGPDTHVLDVGCGRGLALIGAARRGARLAIGVDRWCAVDLSGNNAASMVANAMAEGVASRVAVVTADARSLPLPDGSVDAVVSMTALHNIAGAAERTQALAEIVRVLRPGGELALFDIFHTEAYRRTLAGMGMRETGRSGLLLLWGVPGRRIAYRKEESSFSEEKEAKRLL